MCVKSEFGILDWYSVISQEPGEYHDSQGTNIEALTGSQEQFETFVREQLRQAVRVALMNVLEEEVEAVVGAERYERTEQRRDHRNGHYTRFRDDNGSELICPFLALTWTSNASV